MKASTAIDVFNQIAAVTGALRLVTLNLLDEHLVYCISRGVVDGDGADTKFTEAAAAIACFRSLLVPTTSLGTDW
jgi:DNA-binding FrmR family transcriptional regulator